MSSNFFYVPNLFHSAGNLPTSPTFFPPWVGGTVPCSPSSTELWLTSREPIPRGPFAQLLRLGLPLIFRARVAVYTEPSIQPWYDEQTHGTLRFSSSYKLNERATKKGKRKDEHILQSTFTMISIWITTQFLSTYALSNTDIGTKRLSLRTPYPAYHSALSCERCRIPHTERKQGIFIEGTLAKFWFMARIRQVFCPITPNLYFVELRVTENAINHGLKMNRGWLIFYFRGGKIKSARLPFPSLFLWMWKLSCN